MESRIVMLDGKLEPDVQRAILSTLGKKCRGLGGNGAVFIVDEEIVIKCNRYCGQLAIYEYNALRFIQKHTTIPIPAPIALFQFSETCYFAMQRIKGECLKYRLEYSTTSDAKNKYPALWGQIKRCLKELYDLDAAKFLRITSRDALGSIRALRQAPPVTMDGLTSSSSKLSSKKEVKDWVRMCSDDCASSALMYMLWRPGLKSVLCHGDLHGGNIMVTEDGSLAAIVDWETMQMGPPYKDAVSLLDVTGLFDCMPLCIPEHLAGTLPIKHNNRNLPDQRHRSSPAPH